MATSIYQVIIKAITEVTGLDADDISLDSALDEEDLSIDMVESFPRIIASINEQLDHQLPVQDPVFRTELKACETIAELVDVIETEYQY